MTLQGDSERLERGKRERVSEFPEPPGRRGNGINQRRSTLQESSGKKKEWGRRIFGDTLNGELVKRRKKGIRLRREKRKKRSMQKKESVGAQVSVERVRRSRQGSKRKKGGRRGLRKENTDAAFYCPLGAEGRVRKEKGGSPSGKEKKRGSIGPSWYGRDSHRRFAVA